jgi:phage virion morphogenesis protein
MTFAELAARAKLSGPSNPLVVPVSAAAPLDAPTQRQLVVALTSDVKRRFQTSTAPDGARWRPLKFKRPRGGNKPLLDTGRLMASITGRSTPTEIVVGTAHPAAALHQFGGTVRPKKGQYLAIPLTREAQRAGSPRRMKGTKKVPLFARRVAGQLVGHFLLAKKAVVPARPFLGLSKEAERVVAAILTEAAARKWQQSGRGM